MTLEVEEILMDIVDVLTEAYGYRQLLEIREAAGCDLVDEELTAEVCQDLGADNSQLSANLVKVGFYLGFAHAFETLEEEVH